MIYCSRCGIANRDGSRFCNECGERLAELVVFPCPRCGLLNPRAARFCNECGGHLPSIALAAPAAPAGAGELSANPTVDEEELPLESDLATLADVLGAPLAPSPAHLIPAGPSPVEPVVVAEAREGLGAEAKEGPDAEPATVPAPVVPADVLEASVLPGTDEATTAPASFARAGAPFLAALNGQSAQTAGAGAQAEPEAPVLPHLDDIVDLGDLPELDLPPEAGMREPARAEDAATAALQQADGSWWLPDVAEDETPGGGRQADEPAWLRGMSELHRAATEVLAPEPPRPLSADPPPAGVVVNHEPAVATPEAAAAEVALSPEMLPEWLDETEDGPLRGASLEPIMLSSLPATELSEAGQGRSCAVVAGITVALAGRAAFASVATAAATPAPVPASAGALFAKIVGELRPTGEADLPFSAGGRPASSRWTISRLSVILLFVAVIVLAMALAIKYRLLVLDTLPLLSILA